MTLNVSHTVLSLGMGVQSSTIAIMACLGDLPMPDFAVFADPGWETKETYAYKAWLVEWCAAKKLKIITASKGNIRSDALDKQKRVASMPLWTMMDGRPGMLRRQCTNEYKIAVVCKVIRRELGCVPRQRLKKGEVVLWLGISLDEVVRMKESRVRWITNSWPLIDKRMDRQDCVRYLKKNKLPVPGKSACIGCPYHSDSFWRELKKNSPDEFADAVDFDSHIRGGRAAIKSAVYLHRSCKPLDQAYFGENQRDLFEAECEGHCGL